MNTSRLLPLFTALGITTSTALGGETPQTALLVLNKGDQTLAIVDPATREVVGRAPAGPNPHEVEVSADGQFAFISNYGNDGHTLSVVDLQTQKTLDPVDLGAMRAPHGLDEAKGKIYFTAEGSKMIGRCDPATRTIDWVLGIGQDRTHMIQVSADGNRIFTSDVDSDTITILDQSNDTGWTETHVKVGDGPEGFDVSPDGKQLWAANSHAGTVSVIDLNSKIVTATMEIPTKFANRLQFTPNGKHVLISDISGGDLVIVDVVSRKEIQRLHLGNGAAGTLVRPDGKVAYVSVGSKNGVAVIDLESLEIAEWIKTGPSPDGLGWAVRR